MTHHDETVTVRWDPEAGEFLVLRVSDGPPIVSRGPTVPAALRAFADALESQTPNREDLP